MQNICKARMLLAVANNYTYVINSFLFIINIYYMYFKLFMNLL